MKITKSQLRQIIKEEITKVLQEEWKPPMAQIRDTDVTECDNNKKMLSKLASSYSYSPDEMRALADAYRKKCGAQTTQ
tara:strand:- start:38 stop:271 length:234 start_codon:yes stop_codon:yes gene_type:complete